MRYASQNYKNAMAQQFRDRTYATVSIGVVNHTAQQTAEYVGESAYFSNNYSLFNVGAVDAEYATFEENLIRADGKAYFPPNAEYAQVLPNFGFVSQDLLDPVTIEFSSTQMIKGLTIDFGGGYPTEFYIDSDSGRRTYTNDSWLFKTNDSFNTSYLTITPVHFANSDNHRTRINSITFGVGLLFTNNEIESLELSQEVSYISEELPNTEFTLSILDPNDLFNVDNENSYTQYLAEGQEIDFSIGQTLSDGSIEYIQMPTMYLSRWNNSKHYMSFSATDIFVRLDAPYNGGNYIHTRTLYDDAIAVLTYAGFEADEYFVDTCLRDIVVTNPLPAVSIAQCLQIIANAGRCSLKQGVSGKILLEGNFENIILPSELTITSSGDANWSKPGNIRFGSNIVYADFTENFVSADGSMLFLPSSSSQYLATGFVSAEVADSSGMFTTNPTISIELPSRSTYYGFSMKFAGTVCRKCTVRTYYEDNLIEEFSLNISSSNLYVPHELLSFNKLELEFTEAVPNNRINLLQFSVGELSDYTLSKDDMLSEPFGVYDAKVKNVSVRVCTYTEPENESEAPKLVDDSVYYTHNINSSGQQVTFENPLVSTEAHARLLAEWLANYYANNIIYDVDYRGEPTLDPADVIYLDNDYLNNLMVEIEKLTLKFDGALSGHLDLRRAVNMLREE